MHRPTDVPADETGSRGVRGRRHGGGCGAAGAPGALPRSRGGVPAQADLASVSRGRRIGGLCGSGRYHVAVEALLFARVVVRRAGRKAERKGCGMATLSQRVMLKGLVLLVWFDV